LFGARELHKVARVTCGRVSRSLRKGVAWLR
jgi:hypothetical protein